MRKLFNKKQLILFVLPLILSCGNLENIEIGEPQNIKVRGFEDNYLLVDVELPVNNPSFYTINISDMDVRVFLNDRFLGKLIIDEKIKIKPKQSTIYKLPVKIRIANILGTAFIMMNMKKGKEAAVKFEGEVKARSFLLFKTIEINETRNVRF